MPFTASLICLVYSLVKNLSANIIAATQSRMIDTASKAGPLLAFEFVFIVPHLVPGVPAPNAVALKLAVAEGAEEVDVADSAELAVREADEVALGEEVEDRILGQNPSLQVLIAARNSMSACLQILNVVHTL